MVFLRELLQNSIDAIRMRCELLKNSGLQTDVTHLGYIEVFVENHENDSISITWKDNGIGMDEKTVQNFLAVIGRSYYQSDEFKRLYLAMDPISEFGIGLLTCFTVSNGVEIETKRDQNILSNSKPLRIKIPSINRFFHVEEIDPKFVIDPGTTVKLTISTDLKNSLELNGRPLSVTDYLSKIAGFVEFPILVHENEKNTIILHPYSSPEIIHKRFGSHYDIRQLNLSHSIEDLVISEDVATARQVFKMESYDLSKDLDLNDFEGVLSYPVPLDKDTDFSAGPSEYSALKVLISHHPHLIGRSIRMADSWNGQLFNQVSFYNDMYGSPDGVYRDGILVPGVTMQGPLHGTSHTRILTCLIVNIPKSKSKDISLARDKIITDSSEWTGPIFSAHLEMLRRKYSSNYLEPSQPQRYLFRLASFLTFYVLSPEQLSEIFPREEWPLPFINSHGAVIFKNVAEIADTPINRIPNPLSHSNSRLIQGIIQGSEIPSLYAHWEGPLTIIDNWATWGGSNNDSIITGALKQMIDDCIEYSHQFDDITFLIPPWKNNPPLLQEIWAPKIKSDHLPPKEIQAVLDSIASDPSNVVKLGQQCIQQSFFQAIGFENLQLRLTKFQIPFEKSFAYGHYAMNLNNKIAQALLHLMLLVFNKEKQLNIPLAELNALKVILRRVISLPGAILSGYKSWASATDDLWRIINRVGLASKLDVVTLTPTIDEFIPGSTEQFLDVKVHDTWDKTFGEIVS